MAPSNQSPGHVTPHVAVAFTVPGGEPRKFYGGCSAADFFATDQHDTKAAAEADVAAHVKEMSEQ